MAKKISADDAPPRAGARVPYRVRRGRLRNGLRVCTIVTPYLHTATVALYVRTGSRYETPTTNGLSHFLEHMLFRGSPAHPTSFAFNSAIEELGGSLHAETGRDYSLYSIALAPRRIGGALAILGDLFRGPVFGEVDAERRMVLEEALEDLDDRGRNVNVPDLARAQAFRRHPLGFTILGPERNIRKFSRRDVRRHFRRFYGARNMILCVGGPVSHRRILSLAQTHFGAVHSGRLVRARPARPRLGGPRVRLCATDASQSQLHMLFHGVGMDDPDAVAVGVLVRLIDDGMATPLHYRICDRKGLAYHVAAEHESYFDTSLVEIEAACAPRKLDALAREILDILDEFRKEPPALAKVERARRRYREDLESSFDDVGGLCGWFGGAQLFTRPRTHAQRLAEMEKVTPARIAEVARRIFRRERLTVLVAGSIAAGQARAVRTRLRVF